ncbi:MAG: PAS domain-containing protein [Planctomycetes bacterium]|nr:PAS domain-containing protein [Planctomycetota bacterium]
MSISEDTFNKTQSIEKISVKRFILLYIAIVLFFLAIGPSIFSSTWISSSDFHLSTEIVGSFIALAAGVASLVFFLGLKNHFYLIISLGFFICGSEDLIYGALSFKRLFADSGADFSSFIPGTYVAGRITLAIMIIAAALIERMTKMSKNVRREAIVYSSLALMASGCFTALAITIPLPQFFYPDRLISRPADFISAMLFLIAVLLMWRRYAAKRDVFSGILLASVLFNLCGQVYMSFSKQLFDAFFDLAHFANIFSYIMPIIGISLQGLEEMKTTSKEVAKRSKAQEELQHSKEFMATILECMTDAISIVDAHSFKIVGCNAAFLQESGLEEREVIGKHCYEVNYNHSVPCEPPDGPCPLIETVETGKHSVVEQTLYGKDGSKIYVEVSTTPIKDENGKVIQVIHTSRNITERKRADEAIKIAYERLELSHIELQETQSQLIQNEKLASIGQLAAGVAHEMNTPVGFVTSNFQTLEDYVKKIGELVSMYDELIEQFETSDKSKLRNKVDSICQSRNDMQIDFILEDIIGLFSESREGLDRITDIIQSLRDFSRIDQPGSRDKYNINEGIEATLVVAKNEIKYDADVKTDFSEVPLIFCHSGQINQVFLNILMNAAQAIKAQERDGNGTIAIKTYTADDNAVVCEIVDDGPGIPPETLSKIFDPFFTTKPVGKGTGLGLSVSYDIIINKHNGKLLVDSTVGEGTKFTIKLPIGTKENEEKEIAKNGKENSVICG